MSCNPNPLDPCSRAQFQCDNPCVSTTPGCALLPTQIDTFITQFFGNNLGKILDANNQIDWTLPCGLDAGILANPRLPGESLACYFLRLMEAGIPGTIGPTGDPGDAGQPGSDAFSEVLQNFTQPTLQTPYVSISVAPSPALVEGLFYHIGGSGFYTLLNLNQDGSALFQLLQPQAGAPAVIPSGAVIAVSGMPGINVQGPPGGKGPTGAQGPQKVNSTVTTANFNKPALNGLVSIQVQYNALSEVFSTVFVQVAGDGSEYQVINSDTLGNMTLQLVKDAGGPVLQPAGSTVTMCGPIGTTGGPGGSVKLISGRQGFSPLNHGQSQDPLGFPTPVVNQALTGVYQALGTNAGNTPIFTTPHVTYDVNVPANFNGTFYLVFKVFLQFLQNLPASAVTGGLWMKIVDSVSGDVPGTEHKFAVASDSSPIKGGWFTIPLIVTNNTGASRTWRVYAKHTLTGGNSVFPMAQLGWCGVQWIKLL